MKLSGPKDKDGKKHRVTAKITHDIKNKFDTNALAVTINGRPVGYLSKGDAAKFIKRYDWPISIHALIVGGWKNDENEGHYGVALAFNASEDTFFM
jgi:hypothetical protein